MKYVKGFDYQVCVKYKGEVIASMYFMSLNAAELHYNDMLARLVLHKDATVSLHNYILQYSCTDENCDAF